MRRTLSFACPGGVPKENLSRLLSALTGIACVICSQGQTISWTGAGNGSSWNDAANWSGGIVPGQANDVFIGSGGGNTVTVSGPVSVKSLQCAKSLALTGGSFTLGSGASLISGSLAISGGASITVNGAPGILTVNGSTTANDANFYAVNGGVVRLSGQSSATNKNQNVTWRADGSGSQINFSTLTNLEQGNYQRLYVQAYKGGNVDLHGLASGASAVTVDAQDAGSIVNLSGLSGRWTSQASGQLDLSVQGGAFLLIPNVTQLEHASLRIQGSGGIPTAQINLLTNVTLTVDGTAPNFGMLTNIDDTSVFVINGGVARLTNVVRAAIGNSNPTWRADGGESLIDLSRLTEIDEGYYQRLYVQAYHGGTVDLHRMSSSTAAISVDAQDAGSVLDLSSLSGRWTSLGSGQLDLSVQGGAFLLIPNLTQLEHASLRIQGSGGIPTAQINLLTNVTLTVDGTAPNFGMLTNIDDTSVFVINGGVARLTNVVRAAIGDSNPTWRADGSASLLDLSRLTALDQAYYQRLYVQAYNGGTVDLHRLTSAASALSVDVQDAGSVVDLSGLVGRWSSDTSGQIDLSAQSGAILLIPNVTQLEHASVRIQDSGQVTTAQIDLLTNVTLTVDAAAPNFGRLTNIDDTSIYALNAGIARLTNVMRAVVGDRNPAWQADGTGSLIDLSRLTELEQSYYQRVYVQAYDGGTVDLRALSSSCSGTMAILADGNGSTVNLSGLSSMLGFGSGSPSLTAKDGGSILMNHQGVLLANAFVDVPPGDALLPSRLTATNLLTLCGKPGHSYSIETRDATLPGSPWTFLMRVPLTNATQLLNLVASVGTDLRVFEFVGNPPLLELIVSPVSQLQLCLYGESNKAYQILSTMSLSADSIWQPVDTVTMTNAFRMFQIDSVVAPGLFYRAKQMP